MRQFTTHDPFNLQSNEDANSDAPSTTKQPADEQEVLRQHAAEQSKRFQSPQIIANTRHITVLLVILLVCILILIAMTALQMIYS